MHLIALVLLLAHASVCIGAGVVKRCETDVDPLATPESKDLATALADGGDVTFACPPGAVIKMTRAHKIVYLTVIDGGGKVTLDGKDVTAFFYGEQGWRFYVRNISLRDGPSSFGTHGNGVAFGGLIFGPMELYLSNVDVAGTRSPIAASYVEIKGGRFSNNTGTIVRAPRVRIIEQTEFLDNPEAVPLAPPSGQAGELAVIEDSRFNGNLPIAWQGRVEIRRSSFVNNGTDQSIGGALSISGSGEIEKTEFINNRALLGGAIRFVGGTLHVRRGTFRGNRAALDGGAIQAEADASAFPAPPPMLRLSYSHLDGNQAQNGGAIRIGLALAHAGSVIHPMTMQAKLVKFGGNSAAASGGAIFAGPKVSMAVARALFVGNTAGVEGGAIAARSLLLDRQRLGNVLMVRNRAPAAGGILGTSLEIVNSTVADNSAGGIRTIGAVAGSRATVDLRNTILLNNGGNCPSGAGTTVNDRGQNIQFPGADCGASVAQVDPLLDSMYVPAIGSAARFAGDNETCVSHELVGAKDVFGESRPEGPRCTIGAVERDLERHALHALRNDLEASRTPLGIFLRVLGLRRYSSPAVSDRE